MNGYVTSQTELLQLAPAFRRVLATGMHSQAVAMTLLGHEEIGAEVHDDGDQVFVILTGEQVEITIGETVYPVSAGAIALVPQGVRHNVANVGAEPSLLLTVYAPAQHEDGFVALTKEEAAHEHKY